MLKNVLFPIFGVFLATAFCSVAQEKPLIVEAKPKPNSGWLMYPTRTLDQLTGFSQDNTDTGLDAYGGNAAKNVAGPGFFRTQKIDGRWWFVDPLGNLFFHKGMAAVGLGDSPAGRSAVAQKFGSQENWAEQTARMLKAYGFNGTGAWSSVDLIRHSQTHLVYTEIWDFMATFAKKKGKEKYPNHAILVFEPDFEAFCDEHAKQLVATKNDPWLLGHFSDNELFFYPDALKKYLALPDGDAAHKGALAWLQSRHGATAGPQDITADDLREFIGYLSERYYSVVSRAIKKYDPNHLYLGSRLNMTEMDNNLFMAAAGKYCDVISINYYWWWTPQQGRMRNWVNWSGKPFMITEWYVKGEDSGLKNDTGAGWIVKTQADRGKFYQNFALGLLESRNCVGWHWFKYQDNDPSDLHTDPSNRDSNKGVVTARFEPYPPLLDAMKKLNDRLYLLIDFLDKSQPPAAP